MLHCNGESKQYIVIYNCYRQRHLYILPIVNIQDGNRGIAPTNSKRIYNAYFRVG